MTHNVELRISTTRKGAKWKKVKDADGNKYWYRFKGGGPTDDGDQEFDTDDIMGVFVVTFERASAKKYRFTRFYRDNDPHDQLNVVVDPSGAFVTVTDVCDTECDHMVYGAYVTPVRGKPESQFLCHPRISNKRH